MRILLLLICLNFLVNQMTAQDQCTCWILGEDGVTWSCSDPYWGAVPSNPPDWANPFAEEGVTWAGDC